MNQVRDKDATGCLHAHLNKQVPSTANQRRVIKERV